MTYSQDFSINTRIKYIRWNITATIRHSNNGEWKRISFIIKAYGELFIC